MVGISSYIRMEQNSLYSLINLKSTDKKNPKRHLDINIRSAMIDKYLYRMLSSTLSITNNNKYVCSRLRANG